MSKIYIIVQSNKTDYNNQEMVTKHSALDVISYVGAISAYSGLDDNIEIDRIFSVDNRGNVVHHDIAFKKGKIVLEELPEYR